MALNHAFLITAHAYPEQLKDIVGLLSAPNHYFFINIDRKAKWGHKFMDENRSAHIHFLEGNEQMEVSHGGYSQIAVTLRLLHVAYRYGGMTYFHFISGQDYPIHPNKVFDEYFEQNEGRSFMAIESDEYNRESMKKKYPSRVLPYYFSDIPYRNNKLVNFMVRGLNFISKRIWWRKPIPGLWGGGIGFHGIVVWLSLFLSKKRVILLFSNGFNILVVVMNSFFRHFFMVMRRNLILMVNIHYVILIGIKK